MFGDADDLTVLVYDFDFCDGLAGFFVHRDDLIIAGDRIAKINRTRETNTVVTIGGKGTLIVARLVSSCQPLT